MPAPSEWLVAGLLIAATLAGAVGVYKWARYRRPAHFMDDPGPWRAGLWRYEPGSLDIRDNTIRRVPRGIFMAAESDRVVVNGVEGREGDVFELTEQGTDVLPPDRDDSPEPENDVVDEPGPKPEPEGD